MPARKPASEKPAATPPHRVGPPEAPEALPQPAALADPETVVAPPRTPLADDQEEVTLPDGNIVVVDKAFAEALRASQQKAPASVKQFPPSGSGGAPGEP